ncbi:MAG: hypothetical protein ACFFFC_18520 [Candidatus Thorarchaeota archaeon]
MMLWFMSPASIYACLTAEANDCIQNHITNKSVAARIELTDRFMTALRTASWIQSVRHLNDDLDSSPDNEASHLSISIRPMQAFGGPEEVILNM